MSLDWAQALTPVPPGVVPLDWCDDVVWPDWAAPSVVPSLEDAWRAGHLPFWAFRLLRSWRDTGPAIAAAIATGRRMLRRCADLAAAPLVVESNHPDLGRAGPEVPGPTYRAALGAVALALRRDQQAGGPATLTRCTLASFPAM